MPRPPRVWFPDALYHLIVRGNNREPIFFNEPDYRKYLKVIKEAKTRYACDVFAYALMPNHVHLMLKTGQTHPVSKFMQWVNTTYTVSINHKYKRSGHLFQGRYHSVLVEDDTYALELSRYIHLNPVRAGLARTPDEYRWSSYRAYVGRDEFGLVDTSFILEVISPSTPRQRELFTDFVEGQTPIGKVELGV